MWWWEAHFPNFEQNSFILMTANWVGHLFLVSAIIFLKVLPVVSCYSFGTTLQSIDSVYFQTWHCIIKLFSSTKYLVQNQQRELYLMGCTKHLIGFEKHVATESGITFKYIFLGLLRYLATFNKKWFINYSVSFEKVSLLLFKG